MRISVVINTYNRAHSLGATLDALLHQTHDDFEVIVVNGPSDDETGALLAERAAAVRSVDCPERNLAVSRNLGIDAAAGDVVAFIDDDAIPEARWLEDLSAGYDSGIGGVGGLTLNPTGVNAQYRYSVCDRIGLTDFDRTPPFVAENEPGADPFVYLQGTNCSFLRAALESVGGFDEEIEYNYDETEVCAAIIDAGFPLRALPTAVVHHKFLPSGMRRAEGFTDPFFATKNRAYFALRLGAGHRSREETLATLTDYVEEIKQQFATAVAYGHFSDAERVHFFARADAGLALGIERGTAGVRRGRAIAPRDPAAFLPYPVLRPEGPRLGVCFVSMSYPPLPLGEVGRHTYDLARGLAAAGHEAHVVTRGEAGLDRLDFEEGVWVHRVPGGDRDIPELAGQPLKRALEDAATARGAVERAAERTPIDVVAGGSWGAEPLLIALDGSRPVNVLCVTPVQGRLEDALLASGAALQPVFAAGTPDRRAEFTPARGRDDAVEVLLAVHPEKGEGPTALKAGAELLRTRPSARLRVVEVEDADAVLAANGWSAWARKQTADVADRVVFDGRVTDDALLQACADCDVCVASERHPSVGARAMMMARPLVASEDPLALVAELQRLVDDPQERERLGAAGRERYEGELDPEAVVARQVERLRSLAVAPAGDLPTLLASVCGLDAAAATRAANALRDLRRFPVDLEGAVRRALSEDDAALVDGLFYALLGRPPEPQTRAALVDRIRAGADPRTLAREIAQSPEADLRGLDLAFLDRLPPVARSTIRRSVGAAWLHDDDRAFAAAVRASLDLAPPHATEPEPRDDRAGILRFLLTAAGLPLDDLDWIDALRTESEIADRLAHADAFLDDAYRLLLGRAPDLAGRAAFRNCDRATAVRGIGTSPEARDRGFPPEVAERIAARMPPRGRRARVRRLLGTDVDQAVLRTEARLEARFEASGAELTALGRRLDGLARVQTSPHDLAELRWAIEGLGERLRVLTTKHEAMALDVREKLPATHVLQAPEPVVADADAMARRVAAIGGLRLNIGCGEKPLDGYVNVDFRALPGVDVIADANRLPFEPGTVDEIASFHLIEHFREHHAQTVLLPYWRSLLKPDGRLRVVTPNYAALIDQLREGALTFAQFKKVTFGAQDYSGDDHFALYSPQTLESLLTAAGFSDVEVVVERRQNGLSPELEVTASPSA